MDAADVPCTAARSTHAPSARERSAALEFEATPHRVGQVRRVVRAYLRYWHLPELVEPAVLAAGELVTNVHLHARVPYCALSLTSDDDGVVTLSVRDQDPCLPVFHEPAAGELSESGRGLHLVADLAADCGAAPDPASGGKVVWARLERPGDLSSRASAPAAPLPASATRAVPVAAESASAVRVAGPVAAVAAAAGSDAADAAACTGETAGAADAVAELPPPAAASAAPAAGPSAAPARGSGALPAS